MKKKLKEALRAAGLNEELANGISITSEDQIAGIVAALKSTSTQETSTNYDEILASEGFSKYVTDNGFDKVLTASKTLQREHDRKVTQGVQTFKDNFAKSITTGSGNAPAQGKPNEKDEAPEWAKALSAKIDAIEAKGQAQYKLDQVKALMGKSKLPKDVQERWLSRVNLESETPFTDQIKSLEEEHDVLFKGVVASNSRTGLPNGSGTGDKPSEESVDKVVGNMNI